MFRGCSRVLACCGDWIAYLLTRPGRQLGQSASIDLVTVDGAARVCFVRRPSRHQCSAWRLNHRNGRRDAVLAVTRRRSPVRRRLSVESAGNREAVRQDAAPIELRQRSERRRRQPSEQSSDRQGAKGRREAIQVDIQTAAIRYVHGTDFTCSLKFGLSAYSVAW